MIETKEQYEDDLHDFRQLQPLRTARLEKTIEALRDVARARRAELLKRFQEEAGYPMFSYYLKERHPEMFALSEWLTK
jgi:hypothetical protein